jgi:hypothetical protein
MAPIITTYWFMHVRGRKSHAYFWSVSEKLATEEFSPVADRPHLPMGLADPREQNMTLEVTG